MYLIIYFSDEKTGLNYFVSDFSRTFNKYHIKLDTNPDNACYILSKNLETILSILPSFTKPIVVECEAWLSLKNSF
jgi:hypothetical protein